MDKVIIFGTREYQKKSLRHNSFFPKSVTYLLISLLKNDKGSRLFQQEPLKCQKWIANIY